LLSGQFVNMRGPYRPRGQDSHENHVLRIENFRSIKRLDIQLGETTVFIGPNNSGKTAILDAVRIALTRRWGQRGTGFTEYDIHLATQSDDPRTTALPPDLPEFGLVVGRSTMRAPLPAMLDS
jgi:energy-coupling factor transporter ATP-binding protein EcfA2